MTFFPRIRESGPSVRNSRNEQINSYDMLDHSHHQERGALLLQLRELHAKSWVARLRPASTPSRAAVPRQVARADGSGPISTIPGIAYPQARTALPHQ